MVLPRVLVIGDDATMRELVGDALRKESIHVEAAENCEQALRRYLDCGSLELDLLLLDADSAGMDGVTVCQELRAKTSVPIVMLSTRDDETSIVADLEVCADDYLTKPFSLRELTSRVRAHLRRQRRNAHAFKQELLAFTGLRIGVLRRQVWAQGVLVELSAVQIEILTLLATRPGRAYSREQIMESIWGSGLPSNSRAADVHIRNIRRKIEPDPGSPHYIQTARGLGYRFAEL